MVAELNVFLAEEYVRTTIEDIAKIISLTKRGFYN